MQEKDYDFLAFFLCKQKNSRIHRIGCQRVEKVFFDTLFDFREWYKMLFFFAPKLYDGTARGKKSKCKSLIDTARCRVD